MSTTPTNFQEDLAFAERSRQLLVDRLYPQLTGGRFVSLAGSPGSLYLQKHAHVDAILQLRDGQSIVVEEKFQRGRYNSFLIETLSNVERGTPGWIQTCAADWLLYCFATPGTLECYCICLADLRAWFRSNRVRFRTIEASTRVGGGLYHTRCAVVPIGEVEASVGFSQYTLEEDRP